MPQTILTLLFLIALPACGDDQPKDDASARDGGNDVLGSDAATDTPGVDGPLDSGVDVPVVRNTPFAPTLSNFRIDDVAKDRVYFDSSEEITGGDPSGFTISGNEVTGLTLNPDGPVGHYFTVSTPFNFWHNNTIRYEGGSDIVDSEGNSVFPFSLNYVDNLIPEPEATSAAYYVAADGNDENDGTNASSPFLTFAAALQVADAGSTVWVKAGRYPVSASTDFANSGTPDSPIKVIGYRETPGDITSMYYSFEDGAMAPDLDPTEMPLIDGGNIHRSGLRALGQNYIIMRNLQATRLFLGFSAQNAEGIIVDNCVTKDLYGTGSEQGAGIGMGPMGDGSNYEPTYFRVINSVAVNGGVSNITARGAFNLVENCRTYSDREGGVFGSDYYISITGDHNIVRENFASKFSSDSNPSSHGMGVRGPSHDDADFGARSTYNLFEFNYSKGSRQGYYSRNPRSEFNVFKDNEADGFGGGNNAGNGIQNQTGAANNLYDRMYIHDVQTAFVFTTGLEGADMEELLHTDNNVIQNTIVRDTRYVSRIYRSRYNDGTVTASYAGNRIINTTFENMDALSRGVYDDLEYFGFGENLLTNCVFIDVAGEHERDQFPMFHDMFEISYTNFFGGFGMPDWATTSVMMDPMFDDELRPTTMTPAEITDGGVDIPGLFYDAAGVERSPGSFSMGAFEDAP